MATRGSRIAILAVSGLLAGLTACAGPANEVIVDPVAPTNTASALQVPDPATTADADPEPTDDPPDEPRRKKRKKRPTARRGATNCCAGKNDCKGLGGCKTNSNECRGKNECKGKGGCQVGQCDSSNTVDLDEPPPPPQPSTITSPSGTKMCCKGQNQCKGKGGCKTNDNGCKGQNDCKGKGGCKGPC